LEKTLKVEIYIKRMKALEPPDSHYLQAACGWLGLGDVAEAEAELAQISPSLRRHPEVLQVRWQLHARREEWPVCLDLAKSLTQIAPERRFGWIHLAFSLHRLSRTREALEILLYALDMFEPNATMAFYLSRCCCRLGRMFEGRTWLEKAFALVQQADERRRLKEQAIAEPDLAPLRAEIEKL
jgi:tetratricopeptide (TPR) repeat protein